jgi:Family of unknown function (DUF5367)
MRKRFLLLGFLIWLGASLLLRLAPGRLLAPESAVATLVLYAVSFVGMFLLLDRLVGRLEPSGARLAAIALVSPTLLLDAFAAAFFRSVYPNFQAGAAGIFGGWMLICCAGGLAAVLRRR